MISAETLTEPEFLTVIGGVFLIFIKGGGGV